MTYGGTVPFDAGTLGGYDEENYEVTYLSPTLFGWSEAGSLWCGGAHPYNHWNTYTLDLRTGELLDLSRIFGGWVARAYGEETVADIEAARASPGDYAWGPDEALTAFVLAGASQAADPESDCSIAELIGENLHISFKDGDIAVFSLEGLPHVVTACGGPILEMPLAELKPFLTPEAAEYFPSLGG
jgi:hypothetical protein